MNEIDILAISHQWEEIDAIIEKFRKTKSTELEEIITLLVKTQPYKNFLRSRSGLYAWGCVNHDEAIFTGLK